MQRRLICLAYFCTLLALAFLHSQNVIAQTIKDRVEAKPNSQVLQASFEEGIENSGKLLLEKQSDAIKNPIENLDRNSLPTLQELCERNIMARGGYEVLGSIETIRLYWQHDTSDIVYRTYIKKGRLAMRLEQGGLLSSTTGVVGNTVWRSSLMGKVSFITGNESKSYLTRAEMRPPGEWLRTAKEAKLVGLAMIESKPTYHVNYLSKNNRKIDKYFDIETGLVVRTQKLEGIAGSQTMTIRDFDDYQKFGEVLYPATSKITMGSSVTIYRITDAEFGGELPEDVFEIPDEVASVHKQNEQDLQVFSK